MKLKKISAIFAGLLFARAASALYECEIEWTSCEIGRRIPATMCNCSKVNNVCPAACEYQGYTCVSCPSGEEPDPADLNKCRQCQPGTKSAPQSGDCLQCSAGQYQPLSGQSCCHLCPAGYYSAAGAATCQVCPAGYKCPLEGMPAPTACNAPGEYQNQTGQTKCKLVPDGYKKTSDSTEPVLCGDGAFCAGGAETTCPAPDSGYQLLPTSGTGCQRCKEESIQPESPPQGDTGCLAVKYVKTLDVDGRGRCLSVWDNVDNVEREFYAPAGYYPENGHCKTPCPTGQTSDANARSIEDCYWVAGLMFIDQAAPSGRTIEQLVGDIYEKRDGAGNVQSVAGQCYYEDGQRKIQEVEKQPDPLPGNDPPVAPLDMNPVCPAP